MNIGNSLAKFYAQAKHSFRKNQPEIMVISGIAGFVVTVVAACKETLKANEIAKQAKEEIEAIEIQAENMPEEEVKKAKAAVRVKAAKDIAITYLPSVAMGVASGCSIIGGHNITRNREFAASTALAAVTAKYSEYRDRVASKIGEEAELKLLNDIRTEKVTETIKDPETGEEKSRNVTKDMVGDSLETYKIWLDEISCHCWQEPYESFLSFLTIQEHTANDILERDEIVSLDDVYRWIGYEASKEERRVARNIGWKKGDTISFGLKELAARKSVYGSKYIGINPPRSIQLAFNCRGAIWED